MCKYRTPMQRLKGQFNNLINNIQHISIFEDIQKQCVIESHAKQSSRKNTSTDFIRLFTFENAESIAIHFFFLNKQKQIVEDKHQTIEISFQNDDTYLHSLRYTVEEFREILKNINKEIKTIDCSDKIEMSEKVLKCIRKYFKLNNSLEESMLNLENYSRELFELEISNLKISNDEETNLENKVSNRNRQVEEILTNSEAALEIKKLEKELQNKKDALNLDAQNLRRKLCIDEAKQLLRKTRFAKNIIINDIQKKIIEINKEYRLPDIERDVVIKKVLGG